MDNSNSKEFVDKLINFLEYNDIKTIFSYPGEQILPFYRAIENSNINLVNVKHEQAAAHMADGYSRITNETGVCLVTAGPGATNITTSVATAFRDNSSIVCFTGRCSSKYIGTEFFQEIPMDFLDFEEGSYIFESDDKNLSTIKNVFEKSFFNRKPIQINISKNVYNSLDKSSSLLKITKNYKSYEKYINNYNNSELCNNIHATYKINNMNTTKNSKNLEINEYFETLKNNEIVQNSKNPILLVGQGIFGQLNYSEILQINNMLNSLKIPIVTTYPARGIISEENEKCLGMIGRRGYFANEHLKNCDLIINLGSSLSYNTILESWDDIKSKIVELNVNINNISDIELIVRNINDIFEKCDIFKKYNKNYKNSSHSLNNIIKFGDYSKKVKELIESIPNDSIIVTDAGNHTVFTSLFKTCMLPKSIISSHSMGTMGFGLPCAIGVKYGCIDKSIDREVININGDGGIQMNIQELATVAKNNLKILIVIMKNSRLNIFCDLDNPDYVKLGEAYGITSKLVKSENEIKKCVNEYLEGSGPLILVIECEDESLPKPEN
ncbi:acetolactate synthase-1/2/3 large subunit [Methanococcus voltae]|uniref:thiamine pyrophosphate-binding protein n=1 Tax=Methanococcus voltae TaxID=2188 RepID=UPI001AE86076|nr:thiamine pyrophosphate-binding protein [Methanococcus voltae]MBP2143185.1 acetolactate synthase-1/2/3 large subunit [Methanococcus voltae]